MVPDSGNRWPTRPSALTRLWQVTRIVVLVWLGLLAFFALSQRSMIYLPSKADTTSLGRDALARGFEPWKTSRGEVIGYRSLPSPTDARPTVAILIFHGNAGHAMHRADYASLLRTAAPERAVSVCILEYPGYGARSGHPSQESLLVAASEAVANIPKEVPVIVCGSLRPHRRTPPPHPLRQPRQNRAAPLPASARPLDHARPISGRGLARKLSRPGRHHPRGEGHDRPCQIWPKTLRRVLGPQTSPHRPQADHNDLLHVLPASTWQQAVNFLLTR